MKTVVVLFVLVLTLIGGEAKKAQEDTCKTLCLDKKLKEPACKESCALNKRFKTVWIEAVQCSLKCSKKHGLGSPAAKSCDEGCKKKYEDKVAEVTASCDAVCSKVEKDPLGIEKCKKICTPALIYKEIREALH
ncbi:unnamed protein product [Miscanthus lutarioriparius]|uniref:Uncharacterized protein n=1 Tax=Miscanthus lutarioriparius TaxID=422564 RepID=A0A811SLR9_9POAL|nr:unnamed protein product [Miscanthus lutarioriparius]